jgi:hypothetical protein
VAAAPAHATTTAHATTAAARSTPSPKAVRLQHLKARAAAATAYVCSTISGQFDCAAPITSNSVIFHRRDGQTFDMYRGDEVVVSCYYTGAPLPDNLWDHLVFESSLNHGTNNGQHFFYAGHVADSFVNFNGLTARQVGIAHC